MLSKSVKLNEITLKNWTWERDKHFLIDYSSNHKVNNDEIKIRKVGWKEHIKNTFVGLYMIRLKFKIFLNILIVNKINS